MTWPNDSEDRYCALFASGLQRSDTPTPEMVAEAISMMLSRLGRDGCAGQVAQEFGDHPDEACARMRWARLLTDQLAEEIAAHLASVAPPTEQPSQPPADRAIATAASQQRAPLPEG